MSNDAAPSSAFACTCRFWRKDEFSKAELIEGTICGYHACKERAAPSETGTTDERRMLDLLVKYELLPRAALDDPEGYDLGSTLGSAKDFCRDALAINGPAHQSQGDPPSDIVRQLNGALMNSEGADFNIRADFVLEIIARIAGLERELAEAKEEGNHG